MPKATNAHTLNRRAALGLSVSAVLAGGTPPERGLAAACGEFRRLEQERNSITWPTNDEEWAAVHAEYDARQKPVLDRIVAMRAVTLEDHRARAEALLSMFDGAALDGLKSTCWDDKLAAAMLRDLTAHMES